MNRRGSSRRRGGCGCSLLLLLLLLVGVAVAAEVGARRYLGDRVEQEVSQRIDAPVSDGFGMRPILPELALDRSVDSVRLTSPGNETVPWIDVTGRDLTLVGDGDHAGSPVADLSEVRSVHADPAAGLLRADIGGIAEIGVSPGVSGGQLTLTPEQTSLLGFDLPEGLFSGIAGTVDSTVSALPEGVGID